MALVPNTHLGRYEVRSQLGAGGMGEVYLALDAQLDRTVALKILPSEVVFNEDRMRRFVQEARAAAALNHPSIAHIYEIGESDGTHFIAMEFIDGEPLRGKIHRHLTRHFNIRCCLNEERELVVASALTWACRARKMLRTLSKSIAQNSSSHVHCGFPNHPSRAGDGVATEGHP